MIDYQKINNSIIFYEANGFTRIETPWLVSEYVDNLTKPENKESYTVLHNNKNLVASGEQSFLYLYLKGFLPKGKFQTVTPCFRREKFDFTHSKYFIKNELIQTDIVNENELLNNVEVALTFFKMYLKNSRIVKTEQGFDIMSNDIELGSYGIRSNPVLDWIYATGCAEPRLTRAMKWDTIRQQ